VIVMAERSYAGAYWAGRREDVESCTDRLVRFLAALGEAHPLLETWFEPGNSRVSGAEWPVEPTPQVIRALLLAGRHRGDVDGSVIEELGFLVSLWNGQESDAGLTVGCGRYSKAVGNAVVLNLPQAHGLGAEIYRPHAASRVMKALVSAWEPDWATWTSNALRRAQQSPPRGPVVGWMTYLARPRHVDADRLPAGVHAEEMADGTLITIGPDPTAIPGQLLLAVRESLGDAVLPES